jgi:basic membrane lipoprotein Med (substrate-binding protein (PBP1-ABC) superfamily)
MKRFITLAIVLSLACAKSETPPASTDPEKPRLKVGLLTPGSVNDNGWNAIAYEGLQRVKSELGAEVSHQETKTPAEFEEGFRSFGARGFDLRIEQTEGAIELVDGSIGFKSGMRL